MRGDARQPIPGFDAPPFRDLVGIGRAQDDQRGNRCGAETNVEYRRRNQDLPTVLASAVATPDENPGRDAHVTL